MGTFKDMGMLRKEMGRRGLMAFKDAECHAQSLELLQSWKANEDF